MEKDKTNREITTEVIDEICSLYCKYPALIQNEIPDAEKAQETLLDQFCDGCPLNRLL